MRDALLGRPVTDVDIATPETPDRVMELLEAAGIKALPTGIEHGTVTAVIGGGTCQITTLRRDVSTDGRRAAVAFTEDWRADAGRRDFTFNTLSATPGGMVYDYFNGRRDLNDRAIRFVGHAGERIEEDRLRVLRFFPLHRDAGHADRPRGRSGGLHPGRAAADRAIPGAYPRRDNENPVVRDALRRHPDDAE